MKYTFNDGFWWGAASSAPQTEGASTGHGKSPTKWDHWFQLQPDMFYGRVGPENASDFYHQYKADIARMKETGLNSFRTSISWSRLIPNGDGVLNPEGVAFYNSMIDEMLAQGIEPVINLYHFDTPMWLMEKGGEESREFVDSFAQYAKTCFELFGDRVTQWMTFNEPVVTPLSGYISGHHYPCLHDMKKAVQVAYHTQVASSKAIQAFRRGGHKGRIGIIINVAPPYPRDQNNTEDVKAAHILDLLTNRSFLDPSVLGYYPDELCALLRTLGILPETLPEDADIIRNNTVDYLGVNYYHPERVKMRETPYEGPRPMPGMFYEHYEMPGANMNVSRGWEIYEDALYDVAVNIRDNYKNIPWFVSENGMGVQDEERYMDADGMVQDDYRIDFIQRHLKVLHKAIADGSSCFGYHLWTFCDNWSWINAYKNRYGLYRVDIENGLRRSAKKSALWMRDMIRDGGFDD